MQPSGALFKSMFIPSSASYLFKLESFIRPPRIYFLGVPILNNVGPGITDPIRNSNYGGLLIYCVTSHGSEIKTYNIIYSHPFEVSVDSMFTLKRETNGDVAKIVCPSGVRVVSAFVKIQ